ncbi:PDZ domain-containing protein [Schlesneria sp. T3-172]|uniref:PDZ domain-containing protein n=1 Tax=Schlesneria sphaerica TaxID=3373610 RepID=UPI0037C694E9
MNTSLLAITTCRRGNSACFSRLGPKFMLLALWGFFAITANLIAAEESLESLEETAFKQAAALAAPSIVRIETVGGLEQLEDMLLGNGPTSGVVVSADGYIISSSFNFVSKPSSILVTLPDGRRVAAQQVANDRSKLLTLLKVDAEGLTPAKAAPKNQMKVGQWALALGRTLDNSSPNLSVGIISALNRVWGKAIQTDAKTSPVNYGGALVDVQGQILGVIAPLSPMGGGEAAGVEWYDGGIGFAIPLEDVYQSLDRLKQGSDLLPGLMGITFAGGQALNVPVIVDRVRYNSPAQKAGLKTNDRIIAADGEKTDRVAQFKHLMGRKYAGDTVKVVVVRGETEVPIEIDLVGQLVPYEVPFLGILPVRQAENLDASQAGVSVRFVFADSPAHQAGLTPGDRITKINDVDVQQARQLADLIGRNRSGEHVKVKYTRSGTESSVDVTLGSLPDSVVDELATELILGPASPEAEPADPSEAKPDANVEKKPEVLPKTGKFTATLEGNDHDYWAYVPENYVAGHPYGLVVWVHPMGDPMEATVYKLWKTICDRRGLILIAPKSEKVAGWQPGEAEFIRALIAHFREKYTIDPSRIVLHSFGSGSGMAWLVGTKYRDLIRGVVVAGAPLLGRLSDNEPDYRQQFFFLCGEDDKVLSKVKASVDGMRKLKFPVSFTLLKGVGAKYPEEHAVEEIGRWVDALDRI